MKFTRSRRRMAVAAMAVSLASTGLVSALGTASGASDAHVTGHVLLVGTYKGVKGKYTSIQAAVNAAKAGDWIFVAPGDYRETYDMTNPPAEGNLRSGNYASVLVSTSGLHIRGVNRSSTILDGTSSGAACSSARADQNFGPTVGGRLVGRNGIVVNRANNVSIDNLTTCNFLGGSGDTGNNIWWNGGAGTGKIGLTGYSGSFLTATNTYNGGASTDATYGIFSSDAAGPATWTDTYASNFNDAGMYVGACMQACSITIDKAWMENNALGYSGTNSGGNIVIQNSRFDNNQDGLDTNTQISGDPPPPQNGACPTAAVSKITKTHSCWVVINNTFDHNNNPYVPKAGGAAAGPLGTGLTISGGRNDVVMNNKFISNGAWGLLVVPFPDGDRPPSGVTCTNSGGNSFPGLGCIYDPQNIQVKGNTFTGNGFFGNPSNSDIGQIVLFPNQVVSCYSGNKTPDGTFPTDLQTTNPTCTGKKTPVKTSLESPLLAQALCDTGFGSCSGIGTYPKSSTVIFTPLPKTLASMPNPCLGMPSNAWCVKGKLK